jgi:hypothetical protein
MCKAYLKADEMKAHGADAECQAVKYAQENGLVRIELELKRRELLDLGLSEFRNVTQEKLAAVYAERVAFLHKIERAERDDILAALPSRTRIYAAAWFAGRDVFELASPRTLFRHNKFTRPYGVDLLTPRGVDVFPSRVRIVDLQPVAAPDWHWSKAA